MLFRSIHARDARFGEQVLNLAAVPESPEPDAIAGPAASHAQRGPDHRRIEAGTEPPGFLLQRGVDLRQDRFDGSPVRKLRDPGHPQREIEGLRSTLARRSLETDTRTVDPGRRSAPESDDSRRAILRQRLRKGAENPGHAIRRRTRFSQRVAQHPAPDGLRKIEEPRAIQRCARGPGPIPQRTVRQVLQLRRIGAQRVRENRQTLVHAG